VLIGVEVAARGFAFAAALLLFGTSLFLVYAPHEAFRAEGDAGADQWRGLRHAVRRMQLLCVAVAIVSSVAWLAVHAAIIAGEPLVGAMWEDTLVTVTGQTMFGRVAALRLGLMLLLGMTVAWERRGSCDLAIEIVNAVAAGVALAAITWMGHAVATLGPGGRVHLCADVIHLLAAGAWLGGLPPLALALGRAMGAHALPAGIAARTTRRFSRLGIACVAALLATGIVNAWFLVGRVDALFATPYGQLLLGKLALFALMLVIAARNRAWWTPQIASRATHAEASRRNAALRRLARNASIEVALGLAIAFIVGALGVMIPAMHTGMAGATPPAPHTHLH
jgi:putative copper resistance protein D